MRRFLLGAVVAASATAMLLAAPAYAAKPSISVSPYTVAAGSTVHISGSIPVKKCPASDGATVTGEAALFPPDGFGPTATRDSSGDFALDYVVPTSTPAGTYTVGLRCGGGNVGGHAGVRGRLDSPMVDDDGATGLPAGQGPAHHRRCGRQ